MFYDVDCLCLICKKSSSALYKWFQLVPDPVFRLKFYDFNKLITMLSYYFIDLLGVYKVLFL